MRAMARQFCMEPVASRNETARNWGWLRAVDSIRLTGGLGNPPHKRRARLPEEDRVKAGEELVILRAGAEGASGGADAVERIVTHLGADRNVGGGRPVEAEGNFVQV